jgi:hypothetical protein
MTFDSTTARFTYRIVQQKLHAKSGALLLTIEKRLPRIMTFWFMLAMAGCAVRIAASPHHAAPDLATFLPYVLVVGAPLVSMGLALIWFREGHLMPQPTIRLAIAGKWRKVDRATAARHRLYGSTGLMVSLLVGMLLNVPVRALEYLASIPALTGAIPAWLATLHFMMTFDVVLLTSLYTIAFVAGAPPSAAVPPIAGRDLGDRHHHAARHRPGGGRHRGTAGSSRRRASHLARRQRQEGADQHLPVAALFAAF